jgi:hypothetical protein
MLPLEKQVDRGTTCGTGRTDNRYVKVVAVHYYFSQYRSYRAYMGHPGDLAGGQVQGAQHGTSQLKHFWKFDGVASDAEKSAALARACRSQERYQAQR